MKQKRNYIIVFALAFIFATFFCLYTRELVSETEVVSKMFSTEKTHNDSVKTWLCNEGSNTNKEPDSSDSGCDNSEPDFDHIHDKNKNFIPKIGKLRPPDYRIPPKPKPKEN